MLLIHPPVSKPCEPPAGIAKLSGALKRNGIGHRVLDANMEALLHLVEDRGDSSAAVDTWTRRAFRNVGKNLAALRDKSTYLSPDRYKRAVLDLNRALEMSSAGRSGVSLANYQHPQLSPLKSGDLLRAAERPEKDPFFPYFSRRLRGLLEEDKPAVTGFSLNYLSQALSTFAMVGFLKKECPGTAIVLGGGLVTSWMRRPGWNNPFAGLVDHFVAGPGESELLSLAGRDSAASTQFSPDYALFPVGDYFSPGFILPYSGSSGCYWNRCSFCPEKAEGNPYASVPPLKAAADVRTLTEIHRPALIHLLDNAISGTLMNALIEDPPGPPWYGFARIGRQLADFDFCAALKRSGCIMLKLGLESGDQAVLDRLEKGIDLGIASAALKTLRKVGIASYVYLLFGTPAEKEADARKTLEFTVRHRKEIDFLNLAVFNMPVNARERPQLRTSSFYEGDLSLYTDFAHPAGWDRKKVRLFIENEFRRHPAISSILRRDPPIFTSNHAPLFVRQDRCFLPAP